MNRWFTTKSIIMKKILETKNLTKKFNNGKIIANKNISMIFFANEIHSIVGENGAGKTTLISMLMGITSPSEGQILFNGEDTKIKNPHNANKLGISLVPQHIELVEDKKVWENVMLGQEITNKWGFIDKDESVKIVWDLIKKYDFNLDPNYLVRDLTISQKQKILILKTLYVDAEIIIFDEPTSVLSVNEIEALLMSIKKMKKNGKTIIFISHKLKEIKKISDRISVIRKGEHTLTIENNDKATIDIISNEIIGEKRGVIKYTNPHKPFAETLVKVKNLGTHSENHIQLKNINFDIKKGEIMGIAGVDGSGQNELVKVMLQRKNKINQETFISIDNEEISSKNFEEILNNHISLIPEDRHKEGLILNDSIFNNIFLSTIDSYANKIGFINRKKQQEFSKKIISDLDVRGAKYLKNNISSMSGGNQQKIIVGRELSKNNKLLIAQKPTTGVDIKSIESIYNHFFDYANKGNSILLISDELEELVQVSHRIIVFYNGEIMGIVPSNVKIKTIGKMMLGERYVG